MLRLWVRVVLATSWFAPLPLILGLRLIETNLELSLTLVSLGVGLLLTTFAILLPSRRQSSQEYDLEEKERVPYEWAAQLATFVLPFLALRLTIFSDVVALAFVISLTIFILVRSGDFVANPLLALGGYLVYRVQFASGVSAVILTKGRPGLRAKAVRLRTIQDGLYVGDWIDDH